MNDAAAGLTYGAVVNVLNRFEKRCLPQNSALEVDDEVKSSMKAILRSRDGDSDGVS